MSMKFKPTAVWRTRASPGPGLPTGTSSHLRTSGPPFWWKRMACGIDRLLGFACRGCSAAEMAAEEFETAFTGLVGGGLVPMRAAGPGEGMAAIGIVVHRHVRIALEAGVDLFLRRRRHEFVLAGDVQQ